MQWLAVNNAQTKPLWMAIVWQVRVFRLFDHLEMTVFYQLEIYDVISYERLLHVVCKLHFTVIKTYDISQPKSTSMVHRSIIFSASYCWSTISRAMVVAY